MQCERKPIDDFCDLLPSAKFFLHHFVNAVIARRSRPTLVEISGSKASVPCQRSHGVRGEKERDDNRITRRAL
jgi:hypothetical protein